MKIVKRILIGIVVLIVIVLVSALFIKKEYKVEREISINKSRQEVFDYIKFLKNQNEYSVWAKIDPAMKKTFTGTDGTVGFISAWDSKVKDAGKGEQEIKKIKDGERIDYEIRFKEPFETTDFAYMLTQSTNGNQTLVKWGFNGKMPYPMNIMLLWMNMDEMLGKDLSGGLNNLKHKLET